MGAWGEGTLREKRPGVFEIRVAVGVDPVSGRTVQRSFWFHGAREDAEERRRELAAQFAEYRSIRRAAPFLTVGELLERWVAAQHEWRPSTWVGVRSNVKALSADPIAGRRVATLRPEVVRVTMARWRDAGAGVSVVSGRFRVLRSAVGWAQSESIIDRNPLRDMRGPPRPGTRMHVPEQDVLALLRMSEVLVEKAEASRDSSVSSLNALHKAEQVRLLTRLAADSGARRGELAALKFSDLDGRVLHIERGVSGEQIGPTKTKRTRRLTLGRTTVELWRASEGNLESTSRGCSLWRVGVLARYRPPTAPNRRRYGPLVRRAVCGGRPGRCQPPSPAPLSGHLPGRPGRAPPGSTQARSSRSVHDPAELRPCPSVGRR